VNYLTPADLVIRGGASRSSDVLLEKLQNTIEVYGVAVLSVFIGRPLTGESLEDTYRHICEIGKIPHARIQISTVGTLLDGGFTLEKDDSHGQAANHFHVVFPERPSKSDTSRFIMAFVGPVPNPALSGGSDA